MDWLRKDNWRWIHNSFTVHALIIGGILLILLLIPIIWLVVSKDAPDITETDTPERFVAALSYTIDSRDGEGYRHLMSRILDQETCKRWVSARRAGGIAGPDCGADLPPWYVQQMEKAFKTPSGLYIKTRGFDGERIHLLIGHSGSRETAAIIIKEDGQYRMISDFVLDVAMG